jgi:hypothetical protein
MAAAGVLVKKLAFSGEGIIAANRADNPNTRPHPDLRATLSRRERAGISLLPQGAGRG